MSHKPIRMPAKYKRTPIYECFLNAGMSRKLNRGNASESTKNFQSAAPEMKYIFPRTHTTLMVEYPTSQNVVRVKVLKWKMFSEQKLNFLDQDYIWTTFYLRNVLNGWFPFILSGGVSTCYRTNECSKWEITRTPCTLTICESYPFIHLSKNHPRCVNKRLSSRIFVERKEKTSIL